MFTNLCDTVNNGGPCTKLILPTVCSVYRVEGMRARNRVGYCPIVDGGPNKKVKVSKGDKVRSGQQKQRKGGN